MSRVARAVRGAGSGDDWLGAGRDAHRGAAREGGPYRFPSLWVVGLSAFAVLVVRGLATGFRADDWVFLAHIRSASSWQELLAPSGHFAFYRPAALALFAATYRVWGLQAGGYLLVNALLHVVNALLGAVVLERLGLSKRTAQLAAVLFLIGCGHLQKEVAWACTSGPLACVGACLAVMWSADGVLETTWTTRRRGWIAIAGIAALLIAPLLHESGVVAPVLAALVVVNRRLRSQTPKMTRGALLGLAVAALPALGWVAYLTGLHDRYPAYPSTWVQFPHVVDLLTRYLGFMLVPLQDSQWAPAPFIHAVIEIGAMIAMFVAGVRKRWIGMTLAVFSLIVILPFCLVPMPGRWLEPRYVYFAALPGCGIAAFFLMHGWATWHVWGRRLALAAVLGFIVATLALEFMNFGTYARLAGNERDSAVGEMAASTYDWQRVNRLAAVAPSPPARSPDVAPRP